jgi:glycosyltransferase involved in cell wall biosynthesis
MTPRTVLGLTIYGDGAHLAEAVESILAQTARDFVLLMLDDGSPDRRAEALALEYVRRDARVTYWRHAERQGMIATWREVAETARTRYPGAEFFAWVSDHDRWDARWLERMVQALDRAPAAVLAYPQTQLIDRDGEQVGKEPRVFDTGGLAEVGDRWRRFCWQGYGSGDMVYGLMRASALAGAGTFRLVRSPDRLLMAELTLQGRIVQVPELLWWRRQSSAASVSRQSTTLVAGAPPRHFAWPPSVQHAAVLWRHYRTAVRADAGPAFAPTRLLAMLIEYVLASAWRDVRKTETSKRMGRGVDAAHMVKKLVKKGVRHAVYYTLVGTRLGWARLRRAGRRVVYEALMLTHRTGLRGSSRQGRPR